MAENSNIEWTHHTFNPWIGCTKVSPACDNCYAESWDKRFNGNRWGARSERTRTSAANWKKPLKWNREAEAKSVRYRVFCASLADVFDNHRSIQPSWRGDLWTLIAATPHLDWLLLTKRPQNIQEYLPAHWPTAYRNVWLGTTVENQSEADRRIPRLMEVCATVRFISAEPLLGHVDLRNAELDWVIAGGESGANFRPTDTDWFCSLRDQCQRLDIPFLFKQWHGRSQKEIKARGRQLDGHVWDEYPQAALAAVGGDDD